MRGIHLGTLQCLRFFGACQSTTIQKHLKDRGEIHSIEDVKLALNDLLHAKMIRRATGYKGKTLYVVVRT